MSFMQFAESVYVARLVTLFLLCCPWHGMLCSELSRAERRTISSKVKETPETLESYRPLLFAIAYQMIGSASEAEDLVQETYLRYQQAQSQVEIQSLKSFLTTVTVHLAIDYL